MNQRDTRRIDMAVDRLGVGQFDWQTASTAISGRNENWLGRTTTGRRIFIKRIVGSEAEVTCGIRRTAAFYRTYSDFTKRNLLHTAELLGQDEEAAVQVFEGFDGARNGAQVALSQDFDAILGAKAGEAIGALHGIDPTNVIAVERTLPAPPHEDLFRGLTMEVFYESSYAQLQAWNVMQQDFIIVDLLALLDRTMAGGVKVPVHGDLRLDQFLIANNRLYLTDWEAFQLADPAQDVGSFVGEWLYHAVVQFLAARARSSARRKVPVPNIALTENWRPYSQVRPVVQAFWLAYQKGQPAGPKLAQRAIVFASCHLLERLLIDAQIRPRLDGGGRALFSVARTILLSPEKFIPVLGLGDQS
ncbi:MAG: class V lanthionine synthetase subunit LxmK [Pseudonocardiaceae bacterium]